MKNNPYPGSAESPGGTRGFRGMNWAVLGDNFVEGPLVLDGLSASDDYAAVLAKADSLYAGFERSLGVNTVRLPVNTHTVGSLWWNAYSAVIDAAVSRGLKVILAYWEDGAAAEGRIVDMDAFDTMWSTVVAEYGSNDLVYFEPINEPRGYSASEWTDIAAGWIDSHPAVSRGRILLGGTEYNQDVRPIGADRRLDGTLLSYHHYAFFYGEEDYAGWVESFRERLGDFASRTVVTEFGVQMDLGLDYDDDTSTDNFVRYFRAVTDTMRQLEMGGVYWPAVGGKVAECGYDQYSMYALDSSGTELDVRVRNSSGAGLLKHGWGDDVGVRSADRAFGE